MHSSPTNFHHQGSSYKYLGDFKASFNSPVNTFSDRLRYARAMKHMTQSELARAAGVSQSAIASYESQHRHSSRATFRLAAILKVDPLWLHTGKGSMLPTPASDTGPPARAPVMREPEMHMWPWRTVSPSQFDALKPPHKRLLEATVGAFVQACLEQYALEHTEKEKRQNT